MCLWSFTSEVDPLSVYSCWDCSFLVLSLAQVSLPICHLFGYFFFFDASIQFMSQSVMDKVEFLKPECYHDFVFSYSALSWMLLWAIPGVYPLHAQFRIFVNLFYVIYPICLSVMYVSFPYLLQYYFVSFASTSSFVPVYSKPTCR